MAIHAHDPTAPAMAHDGNAATSHSVPADLITGSVVLDIGGQTGALVIHTDAHRLGDEIEVSRLDDTRWRTHVAVLKRRLPHGVAHAAVFSALREGGYRILGAGPSHPACAHVVAGAVAEVDWRSTQRAAHHPT